METLNKRNTETVEQVIKEQNSKILEQQKSIDGLTNSIYILQQQIIELETRYNSIQIKLMGNKATI